MAGTVDPVYIAGHLLAEPGHRPAAGPCALRLKDGRIASIESVDPASLTVGEAGLLMLPAPANAHDHGRGLRTLAFGAVDDTLEAWLAALAREPRTDPYLNAAVAFSRMAEGGICATNHCHGPQDRSRLFEEAEAVSRAARDVGIRVAFAVPFMNRNRGIYGDRAALLRRLSPEDGDAFLGGLGTPQSIEDTIRLVERVAALEHEGFRVQYGPVGPQWVSDDALEALARASAETGRRVHMHLLETERQRRWADRAYPEGLIAFFDRIGLLSPRLTVAHGVWLRPDECELLADRGVSVAINLSSNLRLRSGLPPFRTFREAGIDMGIGLDASSFDDDEDMLREIRLFWRMSRGFGMEDGLRPGDVFDAALTAGRNTVVSDGGGKITPGAPADILIVNLAAMTEDYIRPDIDIEDVLLTRMAKRHIAKLIVGGRTIVENGRCVLVDRSRMESALMEEARAAQARCAPDDARIARLQRAVLDYYDDEMADWTHAS